MELPDHFDTRPGDARCRDRLLLAQTAGTTTVLELDNRKAPGMRMRVALFKKLIDGAFTGNAECSQHVSFRLTK